MTHPLSPSPCPKVPHQSAHGERSPADDSTSPAGEQPLRQVLGFALKAMKNVKTPADLVRQ